MNTDVYNQVIEVYGPRLKDVAEKIRKSLLGKDLQVSSIEEWNADTYQIHLDVDEIDIDLKILVGSDWDQEEEENGVNFCLDIVERGGRMLGGFTPFNYSDEVWVDAQDTLALQKRWDYFFYNMLEEDICRFIQKELNETNLHKS